MRVRIPPGALCLLSCAACSLQSAGNCENGSGRMDERMCGAGLRRQNLTGTDTRARIMVQVERDC